MMQYKLRYTEDGVEYEIVEDSFNVRDIVGWGLEECHGKGDVWTNIQFLAQNGERVDEFYERLPSALFPKSENVQTAVSETRVVEVANEVSAPPEKSRARRITRAVIDMLRTPFD